MRRIARRMPALLLAAFLPAPAALAAQGVRLEVRPRPGDTLRTRLEQTVQMTGTMRIGDADSSTTVTTSMLVLGRVVSQGREPAGTRVLAITDSVAVKSSGGRGTDAELVRRSLEGQRLNLLLGTDGSAHVMDESDETSTTLRSMVAQMPATLPNHVVSVGDDWQQVMAIPAAGDPTGTQVGALTTTFRLDSLSGDTTLAFISVRGAITRDSSATPLPEGATYVMKGTVLGAVVMDRRRGWITDSRATITIRSVLTPPPGSGSYPMRFLMKISQRLQASR